jgi:hypothetical protein
MPDDAKPKPPPEMVQRGHETRDANVKGIALCGFFGVLALAVIQSGLYFFFSGKAKSFPVPRPVIVAHKSDIAPHRDLVSFQQEQQSELNTYGWIDREHGVVRIPIERAMELLAERGLPVRGEPSKNEKSPLQLQQERAAEK